ncbi:PP-loop family protein [Plasmodium brasilianum]|nr:PP-loop family protein [Plasmodium brasilianum]
MHLVLLLYILYIICHEYLTKCIYLKNAPKIDLNFLRVHFDSIKRKRLNKNVNLKIEKQINDIVLGQIDERGKRKTLLTKHECTGKEDDDDSERGERRDIRRKLFLKNICSLINDENDEKTKELEELKINYSSLISPRISSVSSVGSVGNVGNVGSVGSVDNVGSTDDGSAFATPRKDLIQGINVENQEEIQLVEAYWLCTLRNKYFFSFLKNKKNLLFSVSAGVDSLCLLYSFLFVIYKIIITYAHKDSDSYTSLMNRINSAYTYTHVDISKLIYRNKSEHVHFFASILKNITVLYCNHKTRDECKTERKFLKNICKIYNLKFRTKILTSSSLRKMRKKNESQGVNKNMNNFLLLARTWRRNSYVELTRQICKEEKSGSDDEAVEVAKEMVKSVEGMAGQVVGDRVRGRIFQMVNALPCTLGIRHNYTYKKYTSAIDTYIRISCKKNIMNILLRSQSMNEKNFHSLDSTIWNVLKKIKSLVFIGHHKNDSNETVLFQFFRGIFIKNIRGITYLTYFKNCFLYRPFVKLNKISLFNYMRSINKSWMFDRSNEKIHISRNFLRHVVIPNISFVLKDKGGVKSRLDTFSPSVDGSTPTFSSLYMNNDTILSASDQRYSEEKKKKK